MQLTPELHRFVSLLAEAKLYFVLAAKGTFPGTDERKTEMQELRRCTLAARNYIGEHGGFESLPKPLAVELRVCEKAVERLAE